jgi:flavodoxin
VKSTVIYASRSGNTRRVAETIADVLRQGGEVDLFAVESAPAELGDADLVVIGGPTEGHGMTPAMRQYLDGLSATAVAHRPVAAFDTRLAWPLVLSGSAAQDIAHGLRAKGAYLVVSPESFIVDRKPTLKQGELERSAQWARDVARTAVGRVPVPSGG